MVESSFLLEYLLNLDSFLDFPLDFLDLGFGTPIDVLLKDRHIVEELHNDLPDGQVSVSLTKTQMQREFPTCDANDRF